MSILRRILYTTDFSECSLTALDQSIALARGDGAEIAALHVAEPHRPGTPRPLTPTPAHRHSPTAPTTMTPSSDRRSGC